MSLGERLRRRASVEVLPGAVLPGDLEIYQRLKTTLHSRIVDQLDLAGLDRLPRAQLEAQVAEAVGQMAAGGDLPLNQVERAQMVQDLLDEILGLGPLEPLLRDLSISDILVNGAATIYIERHGRLELTGLRFRDNDHLQQTINRIVSRVGRRVDESSPMVDARLPDGSRVNAIVPPLAVDGPVLSIRRFGATPLRMNDLVQLGSLTHPMCDLLHAAVRAKLNILISGGTGTGKTTLLNVLSSYIAPDERVITIEDAAELQLQQPHVVRLETRPPNVEGRGEAVARDLVRNSLRMRPDRIIVGEVRSVEVIDMLQAMNTGHEGSMATVHANSPRDALTRLLAMMGMSGVPMTESTQAQMISRSIQLIVQLARGADGHRRVVQVAEITGMEGAVIQMQDLFLFRQEGVDGDGHVRGAFAPTGVWPRCADKLARAGHALDPAVFGKPREVAR